MPKNRFLRYRIPALGATLAVAAAAPFLLNSSPTTAATDDEVVPYSQRADTQWVAPPPRTALSERWEYFWNQRAYPTGKVPAGARLAAYRESLQGFRNPNAAFTDMGPKGFTSTVEPTWGQMSGRARALLVDPDTPGRWFLGTATGGVWRTTNSGASWTPLTDNLASLSIGDLAWDLTDATHNTFFVATGEGPAGFYYGAGIFRTTDGGTSFTKLAGSTPFEKMAISNFVVDPANAMNMVACVTSGSHVPGSGAPGPDANTGVWRSTDGGTTFTQVVTTNRCESLSVTPGDFATQYASFTGTFGPTDGLYKSTNGGAAWTQLTTDLPDGPYERLEIGIGSGASTATIYVGGRGSGATRLYKSTNAGANFTALSQDYCTSQCFYDNYIAVSPANADIAYFGGVGLFRTLDGGTTFDQPGTGGGGGAIHVDHHLGVFDPNDATGNTFLELNDGGIYRASDADNAAALSVGFVAVSANVGSVQPYDMDVHPTDPTVFVTGNQDNGTTQRQGSDVWVEYCGGDGGYTMIDHTTPDRRYCTTAYTTGTGGTLDVFWTVNAGADNYNPNQGTMTLGASETAEFIWPLEMDPNTSMTLYAGSQRVWKSVDGGSNWTPATLGSLDFNVTNIFVAQANSLHVWATKTNGEVWQSTDGGTTWNNRTTAALPGRYATSVVVHPTDVNTVFVTYSGFSSTTPAGHVFKSTDGGLTWANSGTLRGAPGNLPDIPVNTIAINPLNPNFVFVGTDIGAYISANGGAMWEKFANLPNAPVTRIKPSQGANILAIATNGRGVWTTPLTSVPVELESFSVE